MSSEPTTESVSRNAMYVLFAMVSLLAFEIAAFVFLLLNLDLGGASMEAIGIFVGVFSAAIAATGTLAATLIQQLWGK